YESGDGKLRKFLLGRGFLLQPATSDKPEDHRAKRRDEAERGIAHAVVRERFGVWKEIQKPGVERPGQMRVLVPVGLEAFQWIQVGPVGRNADLVVRKARSRQRGKGKRQPLADENRHERQPLPTLLRQAQQKQKEIAQAN